MRPRVKHFLAEFEQILSEDDTVYAVLLNHEEIRIMSKERDASPLYMCPLTYVHRRKFPESQPLLVGDYHKAGAAMGLEDPERNEIADSSDGDELFYDPEVRRRLMEITKLQP